MAELLVRVKDKVNADFYLDCQCMKRGDVVHVGEDGHPWSKEEQTNPIWRILKVPDMDMATARTYLTPEVNTDPKSPSKTLQKRMFKIDLDDPAISSDSKTFVSDDKRTQPALLIQDSAAFATLKEVKPAIEDPAVFGASPAVF